MSANLSWKWPSSVAAIFPEPCGDYRCLFDNDRSHGWEVKDVSRCDWHDRLRVVSATKYSGDSNGGTTHTHFKRLRPWRLGYWRARRMVPPTTEGNES